MRNGDRPNPHRRSADQADLIDLSDPRPARWMTLPRLFLFFLAILAVKGGVVATIGRAAYAAMLDDLSAGNVLSRFVALLLYADPFTLGFAELWRDLRI